MNNTFCNRVGCGFSGLLVLGLFFIVNISNAQFYTGSQMSFGKNRIQYTTGKDWSYYRFNQFDTYYYKGGQSLAVYASSYADKQIGVISKKLDFIPDSKIRFLVFNDLSDLKETNIGLITEEEYNVGGVTHVINNKVFLFFNGDHQDFEQQIKRGISQVYLNEMMYGGSAGSKIKNSILLAFPLWYTDGLISYLAEDWSTELDDAVREGVQTGAFRKFDRLDRVEQRYAGHSLWKYIEQRYGKRSVSDVVYMAKINRNIENGFLFVLGLTFDMLIDEWFEHYSKRYQQDLDIYTLPTDPLLKRNKAKRKYAQARISQDGRYLAYTTNEIGRVRVFIQDLESGKKRRIMGYGYRLDEKVDYSYPLLAWSTVSNQLAIIYEKEALNFLVLYDYETKERRVKPLNQFDKVNSFSFNKRGNKLAMSAVQNGQSDIFILSIGGNSYKRITQDAYDDNHPRFVNSSAALVWSSNRLDDTLRMIKQSAKQIAEDTIRGQRNHDLFFYDLTKSGKILRRITSTPLADEIYAMPISYNKFAWISDENGIYNRYVGKFDSIISYVDTATHYRYFTEYDAVSNYGTNILEQDYNQYAGKYAEILSIQGKTRIFVRSIPDFEDYDRQKLIPTAYMRDLQKAYGMELKRRQTLAQKMKEEVEQPKPEVKKIEPAKRKRFRVVSIGENKPQDSDEKIDINNYDFGGEGSEGDKSGEAAMAASRKRGPADEIRAAYVSRPYNVEYDVSQVVTQVDFNYLNYSYQPFTNPQYPIYFSQGFTAFVKLGIMDLFEDYRLVGGAKISPNFQNNEYFLTFSDYKDRLDKDYTFHRVVFDEYRGSWTVTHYIHELFLKVGMPFDNIRGLRGTMALRNDNAVYRSSDNQSLLEEDEMYNNAILRLEYVFDNSRSGGVNILYGTRCKVFGEYYQPLESLQENLFVFGFDFRKYSRIHKSFVWANRLAGSSSQGTRRLIYYMGGVDNWMIAQFNNNIQVDDEQDFAYQTLATNMRGFYQNIRNGNNFLLFNTELRFPPFQYFSRVPVKSSFWNNFMVVGFFDLGTAWTGSNPHSDNNALFRKSVYRNPVEITIINQDDPIVAGYGFGVRSTVFGYYMRADWAWGIENGYVHDKSVFYFSLSLDF